jgi:hypothetical protein
VISQRRLSGDSMTPSSEMTRLADTANQQDHGQRKAEDRHGPAKEGFRQSPGKDGAEKTAHKQPHREDHVHGTGAAAVRINAEATPPAPRYMFFEALASAIRGFVSTIAAASSITPPAAAAAIPAGR